LYTVYMEISKHVCVFFAKDYNRSTIIKRLLQRPTQYVETKLEKHHSTYCTVTEYKLT